MVPIQLGWRAFPRSPGLVTGFIIGGFGLGGLIFSYLAAVLVNPSNLLQEETPEGDRIFSEEVAQRVPHMLRVLALCYTIIFGAAVILVREGSPVSGQEIATDDFVNTEENDEENSVLASSKGGSQTAVSPRSGSTADSEEDRDVENVEKRFTVRQAMQTSQFWIIYAMAVMSIFQGYYTLSVYKSYAYTKEGLQDDIFITKVGSIAAFMGALRFIWSATMDHCGENSFKKVYGTLLLTQTILGATIDKAAESGRSLFALWLCLMIFTEGAHFVVIPTALRTLYREAAPSIYGVVFTYTGLSSLIIMLVGQTSFGKNYSQVFELSAYLSGAALFLLLFCFKEVELENK